MTAREKAHAHWGWIIFTYTHARRTGKKNAFVSLRGRKKQKKWRLLPDKQKIQNLNSRVPSGRTSALPALPPAGLAALAGGAGAAAAAGGAVGRFGGMGAPDERDRLVKKGREKGVRGEG
jgi:hypothetical protein